MIWGFETRQLIEALTVQVRWLYPEPLLTQTAICVGSLPEFGTSVLDVGDLADAGELSYR